MKTYGLWIGETTYDTLYLNGNPIINEYKSDPIKITKDKMGNFYIQYLYEDGSYYPRRLIVEEIRKFKFFEDSENYFQILNNGNLKVVNNIGEEEKYTPHNM